MSKKKKKKDKKDKSKKTSSGNLIESIRSVHSLYEKSLEKTFYEFDLSNEQYRILEIIHFAPAQALSLKQIRESLPNQTSNATRLVEKLKGKKLLSKKSASADKRELRIALTETGAKMLGDVQIKIASIDSDFNRNVKSKNAADMIATLKSIESALNKS